MTFKNGDRVRYVGPNYNVSDYETVYTITDVTDKGFIVRWNDNRHHAQYSNASAHFFTPINDDRPWTTVDDEYADFLVKNAAPLGIEVRTITQYRKKED